MAVVNRAEHWTESQGRGQHPDYQAPHPNKSYETSSRLMIMTMRPEDMLMLGVRSSSYCFPGPCYQRRCHTLDQMAQDHQELECRLAVLVSPQSTIARCLPANSHGRNGETRVREGNELTLPERRGNYIGSATVNRKISLVYPMAKYMLTLWMTSWTETQCSWMQIQTWTFLINLTSSPKALQWVLLLARLLIMHVPDHLPRHMTHPRHLVLGTREHPRKKTFCYARIVRKSLG